MRSVEAPSKALIWHDLVGRTAFERHLNRILGGRIPNITDLQHAIHIVPYRRGHVIKIVCEIGCPAFVLLMIFEIAPVA